MTRSALFRKVLVTGSSGFIGRHLFRRLIEAGCDAWGADLIPPAAGRLRRRFRRCDLLDRNRVANVVGEIAPDAVVHLAARTDMVDTGGVAQYRVNTCGTRLLMEAMANVDSVKRCIFTSTQLVCPIGYVPASDDDLQPANLYGKSKAFMERSIRNRCGGVPEWCIVRPTTVWGPGMGQHYVRFLRMIRRGWYFHVGRDPRWKAYGYVGNVVHQYQQLLVAPAAAINRKVFYLADYQPISLRSWCDGLQRELGARPIRTIPAPVARLAARMGDVINFLGFRNYPFNSLRLENVLAEHRIDLTPLEAVCGDLPCTMEQGIRETARWARSLDGHVQRSA